MDLRREQRFSISVAGRYRKGIGVRYDVAIADVSEYGCQFRDFSGRVTADDKITIRIDNVGPLDARVKWVGNRTIGVEFDLPLHPSVLEHLVNLSERPAAA